MDFNYCYFFNRSISKYGLRWRMDIKKLRNAIGLTLFAIIVGLLISISPAWLEISYAIVFAVIFFYKID